MNRAASIRRATKWNLENKDRRKKHQRSYYRRKKAKAAQKILCKDLKTKLTLFFPRHEIIDGTGRMTDMKSMLTLMAPLKKDPTKILVVLRTPNTEIHFSANNTTDTCPFIIYHLDDFYWFESVDKMKKIFFKGLEERKECEEKTCLVCLDENTPSCMCEVCGTTVCQTCTLKLTDVSSGKVVCPCCRNSQDRFDLKTYVQTSMTDYGIPDHVINRMTDDKFTLDLIKNIMLKRSEAGVVFKSANK